MRILFVLPRMAMGGVERVTLNLMRMLVAENIECRLALRHRRGEFLAEAEALVAVEEIAGEGLWRFVPNLAGLLRRWQPTHIITAFSDVALLTLWARRLARSDAALIHGVHNTHKRVAALPGLRGQFRHLVELWAATRVYSQADAVIAVSEGIRREIMAIRAVAESKIRTIYNPVIPAGLIQTAPKLRAPPSRNGVRLVALGRLVYQKGFDVLIEAMGRVQAQRPWHLDIYGEGPERSRLEYLIMQAGLGTQINLRGYTPEPVLRLCEADWLVLPSRYEGLPTVLIEALACGVPAIACDCPQGPREILLDGKLGLLVPSENPQALALAVSRALAGGCETDADALRKRAADFTFETAYARWRQLLDLTQAHTGVDINPA